MEKYITLASRISKTSASFLLIMAGALASNNLSAQNPPAAAPQSKPVAVVGATIHQGNGKAIPNGTMVFDKGKILTIGDSSVSFNKETTEILEAKGKHVFPGAIALGSTIGLQEIAAVRATLDESEVGDINPNVRALVAYNTDSEIIPTLRNASVLVAQAVPQGGILPGKSSIFSLDGWNWEDAVLSKDDAVWLNWPPFLSHQFNLEDISSSVSKNKERQKAIDQIRKIFADAKAYSQMKDADPANLRLAALKDIFVGTQRLFISADYAKDIIEAIKFCEELGIKKPVIFGGEESYKITGFLKEKNVPVVLKEIHRLPKGDDEDVYLPYELPGILHKAGVKVALSYGPEWWRVRNLNYQAGTATAFSDIDDQEEALKFVTKNPAEIAGIDDKVGTLEQGKRATFVVTNGDMLNMPTNKVEQAYVNGAKITLDDKQKRLYLKYKDKYEGKGE